MSLFGGDTPPPPEDSSGSEFSISPIQSPSDSSDLIIHDGDPQDEVSNTIQIEQEPQSEPPFLAEDLDEDHADGERDLEAIAERQRFEGSDFLWRHYTQNERLLAASLHQVRANDLAAHLFNTHSWKAQTRNTETYATQGPYKRKNKWIAPQANGQKPFYPELGWSTWPFQPEKVPRLGDAEIGNETSASQSRFKEKEVWLEPRKDMEEEVYATMLRLAKDQWYVRSHGAPQTALSRSRSNSRVRRPSSSGLSEGQSDDDDTSPMKVDADDTEDTGNEHMLNHKVPTLSADDDRMRTVLRPSANHILTRFDDLLMALHHNRVGHHAVRRDSDAESSRASSLSRSRSRSLRRSKTWRPFLKKDLSAEQEEDSRPTTSRERSRSGRSRSRKRSKNSRKSPEPRQQRDRSGSQAATGSESDSDYETDHRGPRDWSEVLGLAAMIGWDTVALQRTVARCSSLFNENMTFRTFDSNTASTEAVVSKWSWEHSDSRESGTIASERMTAPDDSEPFGYLCPHTNCDRHTKPFPLGKGFRFREHLKRSHHYSSEQIQRLESTLTIPKHSAMSTKVNPRGWTAPESLVCPHLNCPRSSQPFAQLHRLLEHLRRAHKYDPRQESPPSFSRAASRSTLQDQSSGVDSPGVSDGDTDDEMIGGVHNDGFMQPIGVHVAKRGKGKPRHKQTDEDQHSEPLNPHDSTKFISAP